MKRFRRADAAAIARAFRRDGIVAIDGFLPAAAIDRLRDALLVSVFFRRRRDFDASDAQSVGDRRYLFTVDLKPPFASPALLANPRVLPALKRLLGDDCVVASFGAVAALPGAKAQHLHRDAPLLFPEDYAMSGRLPPHAITLAVPLVELDARSGPTRAWKGSQGWPEKPLARLERRRWIETTMERGSCFLMDYRLLHGGLPNRSRAIRPFLYITFARPWFRDPNFRYQRALSIDPGLLKRLPGACRRLLRLAEN